MSNVLYASDLHLGDVGILKYRKQFSTIEEHDTYIIDRINADVSKRDILWILGDLGENISLYARVNGQKKVVLGNHDDMNIDTMKKLFHKVFGATTKMNLPGLRVVGTHVPIHPQELRYSWDFNVHGHTHAGPVLLPNSKEQDLRYLPLCPEFTDYKAVSREELTESIICRRELALEDPVNYPTFTR